MKILLNPCGSSDPLSLCPPFFKGSSEYNITVLIDQKDSERGLRAVHSRFYLSDTTIGVGIVGPGLIGATLIEQIKEQVSGGGCKARPMRPNEGMELQGAGFDSIRPREHNPCSHIPAHLIGSAPFVQCELLRKQFKIDIRVLGIASSKTMLIQETGIDLDTWKEDMAAKVRLA